MRNPLFNRTPLRILSIVECDDGSAFAVEMTGPNLGFQLQYRHGPGSRYLGNGKWDLGETLAGDLLAHGTVSTEYVADWTAWMASRDRIRPDQANLTVCAPLALDPAEDG